MDNLHPRKLQLDSSLSLLRRSSFFMDLQSMLRREDVDVDVDVDGCSGGNPITGAGR